MVSGSREGFRSVHDISNLRTGEALRRLAHPQLQPLHLDWDRYELTVFERESNQLAHHRRLAGCGRRGEQRGVRLIEPLAISRCRVAKPATEAMHIADHTCKLGIA